MADTPFEEGVLLAVAKAARAVGLETVLIGNAAAALQGAPVTTRDIDFFVRDTESNRRKVEELALRLGGLAVTRPGEPLSTMLRLVGGPVEIDFVFVLSSGARYESVRARASDVRIAQLKLRVASLADIIAAKRAAGRPKDLAALPVLEETARIAGEVSRGARPRRRRADRGGESAGAGVFRPRRG